MICSWQAPRIGVTLAAMQKSKDIISAHMKKLGSKGGILRAERLSPERLREIAVKASKASAKARKIRRSLAA